MSDSFMMVSHVKSLNSVAITVHTIKEPRSGPVKMGEWDIPGQEWDRVRFRMADDTADFYGRPYLIAYMNRAVDDEDHHLHFYKWTSRSAIAIFLGDEDGNDYLIDDSKIEHIGKWWLASQGKWCQRYHVADCPPEREVPVGFKSLGDLIGAITKGVRPV